MTADTKLAMRKEAESLAEAGRHLEASEILEKLATNSPRNPLIWNELGIQYEAAGQSDKALIALRRGHAIDSTYPPTLYNLGKFILDHYMSLDESEQASEQSLLTEAIDFLNANLDQDPDNADAHHYLALAFTLLQNVSMAQAHITVEHRLRQAFNSPVVWRKD